MAGPAEWPAVEALVAPYRMDTREDDPGGVRALLAKLREQQDRIEPTPPVRAPPRRPWAVRETKSSLRTMPYALAVERIYTLAKDKAFVDQVQQVC